MWCEIVHADRVLRAWVRNPQVHVSAVSLFEQQKNEHRPYSLEEIERLKAWFLKYNPKGYMAIFFKEDSRHRLFEMGWPFQPDPAVVRERLPTPDRIIRN
jgi:hypothetical protein